MKDIDFDELDRAVNSLMKTAPDNAAQPSGDAASANAIEPAETVLSIDPTPAPAEPPVVTDALESVVEPAPVIEPQVSSEDSLVKTVGPQENYNPEAAPVEPTATPDSSTTSEEPVVSVPAPAPTAPVVATAPRRGRFMDMVRPSAGRDTRLGSSARVSRQGVSLQPSANVTEETPAQESTPPVETTFDNPMPDMVAPQESIEDTQAVAEVADDTPPLTSPFLPDAKVEKRPLGRPSEPTPPAPAVDLSAELGQAPEVPAVDTYGSSAVEDSISPNKDAQIPEQPLPAELGSELLSIETGSKNLSQEPQPAASVETDNAAPVSSTPEPGVSAVGAARVMATASIPQQYKVQASKTEEVPAPGAIYDSQPLASSSKQRPKWLWIVVLAAIVLIGAAGGAAVYYLGLI